MNDKCPLCGAAGYNTLYKLSGECTGVTIVSCKSCTHVYSLYGNKREEGLYNEGVYKVVENRDSVFDKILNWEYKKVLRHIKRLKPGHLRLLDFGSGKGKFADLAQKEGFDVKCVETSVERAAYAQKVYGLEVNTSYYSAGKIFNGEFNVITLFHVLEHLPEPATLLSELIRSNLINNGLVILEVPNYNSIQRKIAGKRWMHFDAHRHRSHFTPLELEKIGNKLNLEVLKTTYFSFHLGVLGMVDSLLKLFGYRKNIILELKNNKNKTLLIAMGILLLPALLLEIFSTFIGQGGIVRKYFIKY